MNNYYVYIYWRLDTNEVFYVGKGKDRRWKSLKRKNKHFMNIINKHPIAVEIIKDNLTEQEAFYWEEKIIETLVFEYGYSIDIPNNRSKEKGMHLVNCTWGGEGTSGMNPYDMVNEEKKEDWKKKIGKASKLIWEDEYYKEVRKLTNSGENNPMYGKHHSEESKKKMSEARKGKYIGENHPQYGKPFSEEHRKKLKENHADVSGANNPRAKKVICLNTKEIFETIKDACEKYNCDMSISSVCNGKRRYCGTLDNGEPLVWMFLEDYEKATEKDIKRKIKNATRISGTPVLCLTTKIFFYNLKEASEYYNCNMNCIIACCKGKYKSAGKLSDGTKLVWKYLILNHNRTYRIL